MMLLSNPSSDHFSDHHRVDQDWLGLISPGTVLDLECGLLTAVQTLATAPEGGAVVTHQGQVVGIIMAQAVLQALVAKGTGQENGEWNGAIAMDQCLAPWVQRVPPLPLGVSLEQVQHHFCQWSVPLVPQVDGSGQVVGVIRRNPDITHLKGMERNVTTSPQWVTDILESITDGFFALDTRLCFTYVNRKAEYLLHHRREQLLGRNIWDMFPPAQDTLFQITYEQVLREQKTRTFEAFYPPFDTWYEVHVYPTASGLAVYCQDISPRKAIYKQLTHQVQREQALNQVIQVIHQSLELETIFATVVEAVSPLMGHSWVSIVRYLPEAACWRVLASAGGEAMPDTPPGSDISDTDNPLADRLRQGEMVLIHNTQADIKDAVNQAITEQRSESWMLIPLMPSGQTVPWGALGISRPHSDAQPTWRRAEIDLGQTIAQQVAIAIYQAQTYEQAQRELAERQRAEDRLREAQRLAQLGNWELDVVSQTWLWSEQIFHLFGLPVTEPVPPLTEQINYLHPEEQHLWQETLEIAQLTGESFQLDCRLCPPQGSPRYVSLLGDAERGDQGQVVRLFGTLMDITERRQFEDQLAYEAYHDPLTGAPNRAYFMEYLQAESEQARLSAQTYHFAVLFIDLDRFKVINDSLGHLTGDRLLIACTQRLSTVAKERGLFARLSGDEFALLIEHLIDLDQAIAIAQEIQTVLQTPFLIDGRELFVSASVGITTSLSGTIDPVDCLRNADIAMFQAKGKGRNGYMVFDPTMEADNTIRLLLETDLQRAIERDEMHVVYQPIVCLDTGKIAGFEALIRWHHPHFGPIPPSQFIPLAEETGAILQLGQWIRYQACAQLHQWQLAIPQAQELTISVNLSVKQFASLALVDRIQETLMQTGIKGHHLRLEITESALIDNPEMATVILQGLRERDIQLCIDDFGTGYSSLSMVHQYPVQVLKIDRSFVNRLEEDKRGVTMVRTILALAHSLDMEAIAEGVETSGQLRILQDLGCESAQGFFFSCPLSAKEAANLLTSIPHWQL